MGLNPGAVYGMDMPFLTLICCVNCIVCFEKTENIRKEAWVLPIFSKMFLFLGYVCRRICNPVLLLLERQIDSICKRTLDVSVSILADNRLIRCSN